MAEKDDQSPFHSGHTRVLGEDDLPNMANQQPQQPQQGGQFSMDQAWSPHTRALPAEAFEGLDMQSPAGQPPAMPGAPSANRGGQTVALPMDGPQQGGYPPQQGGYPPQQGGYPPGQQQGAPPQGAPPQQGSSGGGGVPYLETQAIDVDQFQGGGAPPQSAPSSGGGVPYLETQAIDVQQHGFNHGQQAGPPPPQAAPPQDGEPPPTVLLDSAGVDQLVNSLGGGGAPPPQQQYQQPPPQYQPPPPQGGFQQPAHAANSSFDSSGLAVGGEKTVMLGDIQDLLPPTPSASPAPQQSGKLVIFVPETEPILFELMPGITNVGRGMENHLVLGDPYASRKHLVITHKSGQYFVEDHGSDNGTVINGNRSSAAALKTGDVVEIGSVQMRFVQGPVLDVHHQRPVPTAPAATGAVMPMSHGPRPAAKGGGKGQLWLLVALVIATLGLMAVMVVILLNR